MKRPATSQAVDVQVLYTEGCAYTPPTLDLVREVAETMCIQVRMSKILIESVEQADEMGFLGSPTVLVNGLDVDPAARKSASYGLM